MLRDASNDHNLQRVFLHLGIPGLADLAQTSKSWREAMTAVRGKVTIVTLSNTDSDLALRLVGRFYPALQSLNVSGAKVTDAGLLAVIRGCPELISMNTAGCPRTLPLTHPLRSKQTMADGRVTWWTTGLTNKFDDEELSVWKVARIPARERRGYIKNCVGTLHVKVIARGGTETMCEWNETTTFRELMKSFCKLQFPGVKVTTLSRPRYFVLGCDRLPESDTPAMRCIVDGDVIHAHVSKSCGRRGKGLGKGSIGEWETATNGNAVLLDEARLRTGMVDLPAILAATRGPPATTQGVLMRRPEMLSPHQCAELVQHTECAFARSDRLVDFKLDISSSMLGKIIGDTLVSEIVSIGESLLRGALSNPRFVLRRRAAAKKKCVPFHRDTGLVVVNAALNDSFLGGNLVCVVDDRIVLPDRPVGCMTIHNNAMVHGVTELLAGVRYNLFCEFK